MVKSTFVTLLKKLCNLPSWPDIMDGMVYLESIH